MHRNITHIESGLKSDPGSVGSIGVGPMFIYLQLTGPGTPMDFIDYQSTLWWFKLHPYWRYQLFHLSFLRDLWKHSVVMNMFVVWSILVFTLEQHLQYIVKSHFNLGRTLQKLDDEVATCEAQMLHWKTNLAIMVSKERQYIQQHSNYKVLSRL